jgi:hypothetical protein
MHRAQQTCGHPMRRHNRQFPRRRRGHVAKLTFDKIIGALAEFGVALLPDDETHGVGVRGKWGKSAGCDQVGFRRRADISTIGHGDYVPTADVSRCNKLRVQ